MNRERKKYPADSSKLTIIDLGMTFSCWIYTKCDFGTKTILWLWDSSNSVDPERYERTRPLPDHYWISESSSEKTNQYE